MIDDDDVGDNSNKLQEVFFDSDLSNFSSHIIFSCQSMVGHSKFSKSCIWSNRK